MQTFFYGLFMDMDLLHGKGVRATNHRLARLDDYRLHIGARAALVRASGRTVYGVLMDVLEEDLQRLYAEPGLDTYVREDLEVTLSDGRRAVAIAYNLPALLLDSRPNVAYAQKLQSVGAKLGLPEEYLAQIRAQAEDSP